MASKSRMSDRPMVPARVAAQPVHSLHDAILTLLDGAIEILSSSQDDEAVHAARKACKRIRAGLRLLRGCLGQSAYRRENQKIRDAAKPLTAVRDVYVLRRVLRTLPAASAMIVRSIDSEYRRERQLLRQRAQNALRQIAATRERLVDLPNIESEADSAIQGVKRSYKAGRKACRKSRSKKDQVLHEWRKQAVYLLNQLELLGMVFGARFKKLHRHVSWLAETLGSDHDLGVLSDRVGRHDVGAKSLLKQIDKRRRKLQARAFRIRKHVYRHPTRRLVARLRARIRGSRNSPSFIVGGR